MLDCLPVPMLRVMRNVFRTMIFSMMRDNTTPGWWEKFVGPGCAIDTDKFFVICTNTLGGCYGSSRCVAQKNYVDISKVKVTLGVQRSKMAINELFWAITMSFILHASVGSSLGGMCSLTAAAMYPDRVGRQVVMVSISSCAQSHPSSIAARYLQRKCIMVDPNWNKGHYYDGKYLKMGMKLARELATMGYRSGPEWDLRFARKRIDEGKPPTLCPTFIIESYIEYQGEQFSTKFDPNSLLYISKAMDIFDIEEGYNSLEEALERVQRELATSLTKSGNSHVTYYEIDSIYGHDTFLLDLNNIGAAVKVLCMVL
ncbi:hypothetical protein DPMN_146833 [Dreissena polymorpha]|uniref:AB hydrolase-1 domain-containing protein n=1 Tax=Dreissena polymorpha TaxID=45954 RepID=A0A9D4J029_DREPO|nr:hypothetical protein DPMN_146833 [Dreissena polymorpha]